MPDVIRDPLLLAYLDLYWLHRGLLAAVANRLGVPEERLEDEAMQWMRGHYTNPVLGAGLERFRRVLLVAQGPPHSPPGAPPAAPPSEPR